MFRAVKVSQHVFVLAWLCTASTSHSSDASLQNDMSVHVEGGQVGLPEQPRCRSGDDTQLPERAAIGLLYTSWVCLRCDFSDAQRVCAFEPRHGERPNHFKPGGVGPLAFLYRAGWAVFFLPGRFNEGCCVTRAAASSVLGVGMLPVIVGSLLSNPMLVTGTCNSVLLWS